MKLLLSHKANRKLKDKHGLRPIDIAKRLYRHGLITIYTTSFHLRVVQGSYNCSGNYGKLYQFQKFRFLSASELSLLSHVGFGPNDHREDAPHFSAFLVHFYRIIH